MKEMKICYAKYPRASYSACGLSKYGDSACNKKPHYLLPLTRTKSKVTCGNCKRTKTFRGVK